MAKDEFRIIDRDESVKNGVKIINQYILALKFFKSKIDNEDFANSESLITVSTNLKVTNSVEKLYLKVASTNDAVKSFFDICKRCREIDPELEKYLIYRYYNELTKEDVLEIMHISSYKYYTLHNDAMILIALIFGKAVYKTVISV